MLLSIQLQQFHPQQWAVFQVEGLTGLTLHLLAQGMFAGTVQVLVGHGQWQARVNHLYHLLALLAEGCTQRFMPDQQRVEGTLQSGSSSSPLKRKAEEML